MDSLTVILGHHFVAILLAKMLVWAPFSQLMCTFSFSINPCRSSITDIDTPNITTGHPFFFLCTFFNWQIYTETSVHVSYWLNIKQSIPNHVSFYQKMDFLLAFPQQLVKFRYSIEFRLRVWTYQTSTYWYALLTMKSWSVF